jgi:hypothetical protein
MPAKIIFCSTLTRKNESGLFFGVARLVEREVVLRVPVVLRRPVVPPRVVRLAETVVLLLFEEDVLADEVALVRRVVVFLAGVFFVVAVFFVVLAADTFVVLFGFGLVVARLLGAFALRRGVVSFFAIKIGSPTYKVTLTNICATNFARIAFSSSNVPEIGIIIT